MLPLQLVGRRLGYVDLPNTRLGNLAHALAITVVGIVAALAAIPTGMLILAVVVGPLATALLRALWPSPGQRATSDRLASAEKLAAALDRQLHDPNRPLRDQAAVNTAELYGRRASRHAGRRP